MDWSRAKTILITAFAIVNMVLGVNLLVKTYGGFKTTIIPQEEINQAVSILESYGISVECDIPGKVPAMPFLTVGHQVIDPQKAAQKFFNTENLKQEKTEDGVSFFYGKEQLIVMNNGIISYFNNEQEEKRYRNLTPQKAKEIAEEFMQNHGGIPDDAKFDRIFYYDQSNSFLVEYVQQYKNYFLASGYIDVLVTESGVKSYYSSWLKVKGYSGPSKKLISPIHALLKMVDVLEHQEGVLTITGIDLGYYSRYYNAESWQAVPVWRITTRQKECYYINGYTGELEQ
jgi:regulatory protein YycI of two-component signal transduction system YycFG